MVVTNMAIKIPSKNTYEISNPKIRDNVIERIEVNAKSITKTYTTKEEVYSQQYDTFYDTQTYPAKIEHIYADKDDGLYKYYAILGNYVSFANERRLTEITAQFKIVKDNSALKRLYSGEEGIGYTIFGGYRYRSMVCPFNGSLIFNTNNQALENTFNVDISNPTYGEWIEDTEKQYQVPNKIEREGELHMFGSKVADLTTSLEIPYVGNINDLTFDKITIDNEEYIQVKIKNILCGADIIRMSGQTVPITDGIELSNYSGTMSGTQTQYEPSYIEISFNGDTIKIDISDKTIYVPTDDKNSKKVYSAEGSELMQTSNYLKDSSENAIETMYGGTRNQYQNGKETATLLCDINDYYDESDKLKISSKREKQEFPLENVEVSFESQIVISTIKVSIDKPYNGDIAVKVKYKGLASGYKETYIYINENETSREETFAFVNIQEVELVEAFIVLPMSFRLHDQVIPYVYGANGQDQPMSKYQNGTAKVFEVVGSNIIYDGAVWQELTLQEIYNNFTENT